jgi:hypothetical protein
MDEYATGINIVHVKISSYLLETFYLQTQYEQLEKSADLSKSEPQASATPCIISIPYKTATTTTAAPYIGSACGCTPAADEDHDICILVPRSIPHLFLF